jgi:GT2 family glycosyltransferase/ubiquinone/menaquinone biosynthesis C-methylase UbiE
MTYSANPTANPADWRQGLFDHIRSTAQTILLVGCGDGDLGFALKQRSAVRVIGIEPDPALARQARALIDEVIVASLDRTDLIPLPDASVDCIVYADALGRLTDPIPMLTGHARLLTSTGVVVVSEPNVRHHSAIAQLLGGRWDYSGASVLQPGAARLFTRASLIDTLSDAGFSTLSVHGLAAAAPPNDWNRIVSGLRQAGIETDDLAREAAVERFFVTADPRVQKLRHAEQNLTGLLSIVILSRNELEATQRCVQAVKDHIRMPYEIIAVDNGSIDGTVEFWRNQIETSFDGHAPIRVIFNVEGQGFPVGCNQGLGEARGDYVLFLSNDVYVQPGAIERLAAWLDYDPSIGLVGPRTTFAGGVQMVPDAPRIDREAIRQFAQTWMAEHQGSGEAHLRLLGFCMMGRREVFEKVGGFDPQFTPGNFEDDDLCIRVIRAGYRVWMANDAFVEHDGARTIGKSQVEYTNLLERNRQKFFAKWGGNDSQHQLQVSANAVQGPFDHDIDFIPPWRNAPWPVATDRLVRFVAWPEWKDAAELRRLLDLLPRATEGANELCLCVRLDPERDPSMEQALALLEEAAAEFPDDDLHLLVIDDEIEPAEWSGLGSATVAAIEPRDLADIDPAHQAFLQALGKPILRDLASVEAAINQQLARYASSRALGPEKTNGHVLQVVQ